MKNETKQFYEVILFKNGEVVDRIKTSSFSVYKGEYERLEKMTKASPLFELVVNLYDFNNEFEKRIK